MIIRTLTPYYMLGQDSGFPPTNYNVQSSSNNQHVNARSDAHMQLIRQIGGAAAVLLKNTNNALPLVSPAKIAVIGQDAANTTGCALNACDDGTLSVGSVCTIAISVFFFAGLTLMPTFLRTLVGGGQGRTLWRTSSPL